MCRQIAQRRQFGERPIFVTNLPACRRAVSIMVFVAPRPGDRRIDDRLVEL